MTVISDITNLHCSLSCHDSVEKMLSCVYLPTMAWMNITIVMITWQSQLGDRGVNWERNDKKLVTDMISASMNNNE